MTAEQRYRRAEELGKTPTEAAARELLGLLDDHGEVMTDEGCSVYDVDPTYATVRSAAIVSLRAIAPHVVPVLVEALATAESSIAYELVGMVERLPGDLLVALPAATHGAIVAAAERHDMKYSRAAWERDFARRAFATPEAMWRARLTEHPDPSRRDEALHHLDIAANKDALAAEVLAWLVLERPPLSTIMLISALHRLPLPAHVVRELASMPAILRAHPSLLVVLARHGQASIIPLAVELLDHLSSGFLPWTPQSPLDAPRWKYCVEALQLLGVGDQRPVLVERLLARNEQMSLLGSLRSRLLDVLGDPAALLAEIEPRLAALEATGDVVDRNRAAEIRRYIAARIAR